MGDPARAALDLSGEILARLDAATAQPSVESAPLIAEENTMNDELASLEKIIDTAVEAGDENQVRMLTEKGKAIIREERSAHEKKLDDAQDYFNEALKEYGESGEQTKAASAEVEKYKRYISSFDSFIEQQDAYYDAVLAYMHSSDALPGPEAETPPVAQERTQSLAELMQVLERAEAAYRARLDEIKVEKQDVAQRIIDERIAALKGQLAS
jgi:hypothetical protein